MACASTSCLRKQAQRSSLLHLAKPHHNASANGWKHSSGLPSSLRSWGVSCPLQAPRPALQLISGSQLWSKGLSMPSRRDAASLKAVHGHQEANTGLLDGHGGPEASSRVPGQHSNVVRSAGESDDSFWARGGGFDPTLPAEEAWTAPAGWYTSSAVAQRELETVFGREWIAVGPAAFVAAPGEFMTGSIGNTPYVVCRDSSGTLRAFHNVCRHHAAPVASGRGCSKILTCPYHGWSYNLDGSLAHTTRLRGIRNFDPADFGLVPIPQVAVVGPVVLLNLGVGAAEVGGNTGASVSQQWLGDLEMPLRDADFFSPRFKHVASVEYDVKSNWKVFVDNYLDGGYHVPFAHPALIEGLDVANYKTELFHRGSLQTCGSKQQGDADRLGKRAVYAYAYPNFMVNIYGPWLETNVVFPLTPSTCKVMFEYSLDANVLAEHGQQYVTDSLTASDQVQKEDEWLCEFVQRGLASPAYNVGRYAPQVEHGMHQFHRMLQGSLSAAL